MTDREAMLKALDALEILNGAETVDGIFIYTTDEIFALRQALAQPEQEPVAWIGNADFVKGQFVEGRVRRVWWECNTGVGQPLYTEPPRKEWVGLTDDEIEKIVDLNTSDDGVFDIWCDGIAVAHIVCAKLKEKNA